MHLQNKGRADDARDRNGITEEIVVHSLIERRIDRIGACGHKEGVSVWRCLHDCFSGCMGAGSWSVLDNELLTESL